MTRTIAEALATAVSAKKRCVKNNNHVWHERWTERIENLLAEAPSGSGWDCGTKFDEEASSNRKLVFTGSWHHMDENGYYDGWTDHTITVVPTFEGPDVSVEGENRDDIHDYLGDLFYNWLTRPNHDWDTNQITGVSIEPLRIGDRH